MAKKRVVYGENGNPFLVDDKAIDHPGVVIPQNLSTAGLTGANAISALVGAINQILANQREFATALGIPVRTS